MPRGASKPYDLVIVGMGSAGVVAAHFAPLLGLKVACVEAHRIGGDCLWTGCVPSKALLAIAHRAHAMRTADALGLTPHVPAVDRTAVMERVKAVQAQVEREDDNPEEFTKLGAEVLMGERARFLDPHHVQVGDRILHTKLTLLCTGSHPVVPPVPGLRELEPRTSETFWDLDALPGSLTILGAGPIGVELAQACARLGTEVHLVDVADRILAREEPELADAVAQRLRGDGVRLHLDAKATEARRGPEGTVELALEGGEWLRTEELLVASGRKPNVDGLGLEAAGVALTEQGFVQADERGRTTAPSVRATGDVVGRYQFTHSAAADTAATLRDAFFPGKGVVPELVPWVTFCDPELAHAGLTEAEAVERHGAGKVKARVHDLTTTDRARADAVDLAQLKLVTVRGKLVGAHLLAPHAGETIGELALAIKEGKRVTDLASLVHPYPAIATGVQQAAGRVATEVGVKLAPLARLASWRRASA